MMPHADLLSRVEGVPGASEYLAGALEEQRPPLALLLGAVGIPSVSFREEHVAAFLEEQLPAFGWGRAWRDEMGNCIASRGKGDKELLLLGHMDTVPGGPEVRVEKGLLFGRGSVDAKGPLCAFAAAGGRMSLPEGWRITFAGVVGEETDSRGMRYLMAHRKAPAGCLIGEPSGTRGITLGYRGRLLLRLWSEDGGAHRSGDGGPQTRVLQAAAAVLVWAGERDDPSEPVIRRTSGSVFSMKGYEAGHRFGEVVLDIRLPLGTSPREWGEEAREIGAFWGVNTEVREALPAAMTTKNDSLVRALRVAVRRRGHQPRLVAKGGTADLNHAAAWGCPLAAYGPGDSQLDHTAREHILLEEYLESIGVLEEGLALFCESFK